MILYKSSLPLSNTWPIIILSTRLLNISSLNLVSPLYCFKIFVILFICSNFSLRDNSKSLLSASLFSNSLILLVISISLLFSISCDILLSNFKSIKLDNLFWRFKISSFILSELKLLFSLITSLTFFIKVLIYLSLFSKSLL